MGEFSSDVSRLSASWLLAICLEVMGCNVIRNTRMAVAVLLSLICYCGAGSSAFAQSSSASTGREFPAFSAGDEAYRRAESRRRAEVAQQVGTIQYVQWLNSRLSWPLRVPYPVDRAAYYGYGGRTSSVSGVGAFERWPYLPGDIWGFSYSPSRRARALAPDIPVPPKPPVDDDKPAGEPAAEIVRPGPVSY